MLSTTIKLLKNQLKTLVSTPISPFLRKNIDVGIKK